MGHRFVLECVVHREVISVIFFFSAVYAGPQFVEIQKFCYHGNVTPRVSLSDLERQIGYEDPKSPSVFSARFPFQYARWRCVVCLTRPSNCAPSHCGWLIL